ncbi:MAG: hypothetical protein FJW34_03555 [Acidobacteria bacterium]|nr:hypothetical protein [Acidobacteriota bacterium]
MSTEQQDAIRQAVRGLRQALGDTQQSFAQRLGLAISTVVRYELTRAPRGVELARFWQLAVQHKLPEYADSFARAMADELNMRAERIPRSLEESGWTDFLFLTMRNRHVPEVRRRWFKAARLLLENFKPIAERFRTGQKVLGYRADDFELLEAEARDLKEDLDKGAWV